MEKGISYLLEQDVIFERISKQYGFPFQPKRPQGFQTLVLLILEQQVSVDSAKATFNKLKTAIPDFIPEKVVVFFRRRFSCLWRESSKNEIYKRSF